MAQPGGIRAGHAYVEIFADNSPLAKGLRNAEAHLKKWGNTVRSMGLKMVAAGGAMMAPLYKGVTTFGTFEEQMRKVSTQLKNPEQWMDAYSSGIRKMAVEFGEGTDTLSNGLYDILSASFAPAEAMDILSVAVKAARGGMTDTATAVDGLTSVLNSYQLTAKDAGRISDVMFASVLRGKMEFPDLAANIGKVAPMAKVAGMAIEDMFAVLSTMTRQGLSTEEAITRLNNVLKQMPDAGKDILGLAQKYVGADLARIQLDFPEFRASSGIAILAGDIKGLAEDLDLMRNSVGLAEEAFKKMSGGVSMAFLKAKASINDVFITIGEALAPSVVEATAAFQDAASAVGKWVAQNKDLVVLSLKIATALIGLGSVLLVINTVLGTVVSLIIKSVWALRLLVALLTSPIGIAFAIPVVVTAVAALVVQLRKAKESTTEFASETDKNIAKLKEEKKALEETAAAAASAAAKRGATMSGMGRMMAGLPPLPTDLTEDEKRAERINLMKQMEVDARIGTLESEKRAQEAVRKAMAERLTEHLMKVREVTEEQKKLNQHIKAQGELYPPTLDEKISATEDKLRTAIEAWHEMRETAETAGLAGSEALDAQRSMVIALRKEVEALKRVQVLQGAQKEIESSRQTSALQGGGVNLQEDQRQALLGAYKQLSTMPGFDKQSEEAANLRTQIEALQTPMQAFIGQLQAIPALWQQIGSLMFDTLGTITSGIGNMVAQALIYQQDIGKMGLALLKQIGAQVISTIIQIGIQQIIASLVGKLAFMTEVVGKMKGYAAMTYAAVFAAHAGIPFVGPFLAAGYASAAVGAMLTGAAAAGTLGAVAGLALGYDKGGISLSPQLAAVSERGHPELHLTRPNIRRFFPELYSGGSGTLHVSLEVDGDRMAEKVLRLSPDILRRHGITI